MILLDTHALLWLDRDDPALGATSRERIAAAWSSGEVAVSAISFWEVAMLAARGRVSLRQPPQSWRLDWLQAGLEEIALDGSVALGAVALEAFHPDPADRFIVATALARGATLLTADRAILEWPAALLRCDATS